MKLQDQKKDLLNKYLDFAQLSHINQYLGDKNSTLRMRALHF